LQIILTKVNASSTFYIYEVTTIVTIIVTRDYSSGTAGGFK